MHTIACNSRPRILQQTRTAARRYLTIQGQQALGILGENQIAVRHGELEQSSTVRLRFYVGTADRQPHFAFYCNTQMANEFLKQPKYKMPFQLGEPIEDILLRLKHQRNPIAQGWTSPLLKTTKILLSLFSKSDAILLDVWCIDESEQLVAIKAKLIIDDAAYRSAGRQKDLQALRDVEQEVAEEVEAEQDGIVYIK